MSGSVHRLRRALALLALMSQRSAHARAGIAPQVSNTPQGRIHAEDEWRTGADQRGGARREDRRGRAGLKQSDFTIYENGKEQQIATFDFESVDMATPLNEATVSGLAAGATSNGQKAVVVAKPEDLRNHRLIVMFFDLTSMQPEDLERSVEAAQAFSEEQRCSRPIWWRWFRWATRSTWIRISPPTRMR